MGIHLAHLVRRRGKGGVCAARGHNENCNGGARDSARLARCGPPRPGKEGHDAHQAELTLAVGVAHHRFLSRRGKARRGPVPSRPTLAAVAAVGSIARRRGWGRAELSTAGRRPVLTIPPLLLLERRVVSGRAVQSGTLLHADSDCRLRRTGTADASRTELRTFKLFPARRVRVRLGVRRFLRWPGPTDIERSGSHTCPRALVGTCPRALVDQIYSCSVRWEQGGHSRTTVRMLYCDTLSDRNRPFLRGRGAAAGTLDGSARQ